MPLQQQVEHIAGAACVCVHALVVSRVGLHTSAWRMSIWLQGWWGKHGEGIASVGASAQTFPVSLDRSPVSLDKLLAGEEASSHASQ